MVREEVERRCLEIERSLYLDGFVSETPWLNADITREVEISGRNARYILLSQATRFGITYLGYIDPQTREFRKFDPELHTSFESTQAGGGGRKTKMYVPVTQLPDLRTLEEVLSIPGISIRREITS